MKVFTSTFYDIVMEGQLLERVATGFLFTEGPIWHADSKSLFFSDIKGNTLYRWFQETNALAVHRRPNAKGNGNTWDTTGELLTCEHVGRRVAREQSDGTLRTVVDSYEGKRLNSPNDIVVRSDGRIFFTDPNYGLTEGFGQKGEQEQPCQGVYTVSPGGTIARVVDDFDQPNGLAFTPDEKYLYVNDTNRQHVRIFEVAADGALTKGRIFVDLDPSFGPGVPDGMKVDTEGNVYVTGPSGVWVITPQGIPQGIIMTPEVPANLAFGDDDRQTLYITAETSVYRIRLNKRG
jgi:gluconolactonase